MAHLHALDIAAALRLAQVPEATYQRLADDLGVSLSQAHSSVGRLHSSRLLLAGRRRVNAHALLEFLEHGVQYAFPAIVGGEARGVATAYAAPALVEELVVDQPMVWPSGGGDAFGPSIDPLYPQAVTLPQRCPELYGALALVDALRVGRVRERKLAADALGRVVRPASQ